jgi:DNA-binding transcriptional LysR family regulator
MSIANAQVCRTRLSSRARVRQIEAFVAVAELGSLNDAAQRLNISQPGMTKHIKDLEELLGATLFLRHAKGMALSRTGEELLPSARRVLANFDDMAERTAALAERNHSLIRVIASQGGISAVLMRAVAEFVQLSPQILLTVNEATPFELSAAVARGEADLAVCRQPDQIPQGWHFVPVREDQLVVVAGPQHPLSRRAASVSLAVLAQQTWLPWPLESQARRGFERLFEHREPPRLWSVTTRSPVMLWSTLRSNNIVALLPESYLSAFVESQDLVRISTRLKLPLAPLGVMTPIQASFAATRFSQFICARKLRHRADRAS